MAEADLANAPCQRMFEDALRGEGVAFRSPRRKIYITEEDAKKRRAVAKAWIKRPRPFWSAKVHAYVDNKAFAPRLTPKQRTRYRLTMLLGHL